MTDTAELERVALAIEATMFAPHELPLPADLHAKYLETAKAAIAAQQDGAREADTLPIKVLRDLLDAEAAYRSAMQIYADHPRHHTRIRAESHWYHAKTVAKCVVENAERGAEQGTSK